MDGKRKPEGRHIRFSRDRKLPPQTIAEFLASRFPYFTHAQWSALMNGTLELNPSAGTQSPTSPASATTTFPQQQHPLQPKQEKPVILLNGDLCSNPATILKQQDVITFIAPPALEPDVDADGCRLLYVDPLFVVALKSGNIPVCEGGRYRHNTLIRVARERLANILLSGEDGGKGQGERRRGTSDSDGALRSACRDDDTNDSSTHSTPPVLFPVHRLDKETSGIVIFARTKAAAQVFAQLFGEKQQEGDNADNADGKDKMDENRSPAIPTADASSEGLGATTASVLFQSPPPLVCGSSSTSTPLITFFGKTAPATARPNGGSGCGSGGIQKEYRALVNVPHGHPLLLPHLPTDIAPPATATTAANTIHTPTYRVQYRIGFECEKCEDRIRVEELEKGQPRESEAHPPLSPPGTLPSEHTPQQVPPPPEQRRSLSDKMKMACFPHNDLGGRGKAATSLVTLLGTLQPPMDCLHSSPPPPSPYSSGVGGSKAVAPRTDCNVSSALCVAAVRILTGRTHQIRVHLAAMGMPIVGDKLYECNGQAFSAKEGLKDLDESRIMDWHASPVDGTCSDAVFLTRSRGEQSVVVGYGTSSTASTTADTRGISNDNKYSAQVRGRSFVLTADRHCLHAAILTIPLAPLHSLYQSWMDDQQSKQQQDDDDTHNSSRGASCQSVLECLTVDAVRRLLIPAVSMRIDASLLAAFEDCLHS